MRYIAFAEYNPEDLDKMMIKQRDLINAERKKFPKRYPKKFLSDHALVGALPALTKAGCTLAFYETDDPAQLANIANRWGPMIKFTFVPIMDAAVTLKSWENMKE